MRGAEEAKKEHNISDAKQEPRGFPDVGETPLVGRAAVIAGASSGIGRATGRALAAAGARVGLAARRAERLVELKEEIDQSGGAKVTPGLSSVGSPPVTRSSQVPRNSSTHDVPPYSR
jgi:hypothetical protein